MGNYSYSELHDMQEKAMDRVRDMQRRAKYTAEIADSELSPSVAAEAHKSLPYSPPVAKDNSVKQHHIKMPINMPERDGTYPTFKTYFKDENAAPKLNADKPGKTNILEKVLEEPDQAMLLSLMMLLKSEGTDESLLMSLLYIMS